MNLNSGFINSTIICNEKKDVDLDALNLLASGEVAGLCQCSYKSESKHHHFIYTEISYDFDQTCWLCDCLESNAFNHQFCGNCGKKRPW